MAIQFRRGQFNKFDKTKMLAGEPAVVLGGDPDTADGKALYIAFAQGDATRMARADEIPGEASQSAAGLMSAGDKAKLDGVAVGANAYVHPSYTARTGKPTGNQTPAFGGTFPVSQIVTDAQGHVTAATDRTVRIPDTEASQGAHGLMSAADKKALDAIKVTSGNKLHRLVTAPVVTASDAYAAPPVALVVDGKSVQDGTPAPDAPVAIQSVESVGFAAHGANMAALPYANNRDAGATGTLANGVTWTVNADGSITLDGTATAKGGLDVLSQGWSHAGKVTRGMAYTFSCDSNLVRCKAWAQGSGSDRFAYGSIMQTIPLTGNWNFGINIPSGTVLSNVVVRPQLECGRHVHEWAPPTTPSLTPIPLQGHALRSLPDGTHDELRVDADGNVTLVQRVGSVTLDGSSDEGWRYSSSSSYSDPTNGKYCYFTEPIFDANIRKGTTLFTSSMASHYRFVTLSTLQSNKEQGTCTFSAQDTHPSFTIITPHTALSDMTTWLASNPVTVDYPLATPVEIQLGTVALPSMPAPDLTAWASCTPATDIELDYERDVNIALAAAESVAANSLAPADGPTATASHAAGSLLTLGGQLVKATRAIVAGEQIAIGTNVAVTTVAAELAALA